MRLPLRFGPTPAIRRPCAGSSRAMAQAEIGAPPPVAPVRNACRRWVLQRSLSPRVSGTLPKRRDSAVVVKRILGALHPSRTLTYLARVLRELIILRHMRHPNLISCVSVVQDRSDLLITCPELDCDLAAVLRTPRTPQSNARPL